MCYNLRFSGITEQTQGKTIKEFMLSALKLTQEISPSNKSITLSQKTTTPVDQDPSSTNIEHYKQKELVKSRGKEQK